MPTEQNYPQQFTDYDSYLRWSRQVSGTDSTPVAETQEPDDDSDSLNTKSPPPPKGSIRYTESLTLGCKSIEAYKQYVATAEESHPDGTRCLRFSGRTRVSTTGKFKDWNSDLGTVVRFIQVRYKGSLFYIEDLHLIELGDLPQVTPKHRKLIDEVRRLYKDLKAVRYKSQFHDCIYSACSPLPENWLSDINFEREDGQALLSIGFDFIPFELYDIGMGWGETKGRGNARTSELQRHLDQVLEAFDSDHAVDP